MLKIKTLLLFQIIFTFIFLLSGCDLINPDEQVPSYIEINDITVNEDFSQVTDAWVYVDDYLVGVYDLPAHFPVLKSGDVDIAVRPGIRVNGIAVTRGYYPFYKEWDASATLTEGQTTVLSPETEYVSGLDIAWSEDFETVSLTMQPHDTSTMNFIKTDTVSDAPSLIVGAIPLGPDSLFSVETIDQFELPSSGPVYLELSYKTEIPFELAWRVQNLQTMVIRDNRIYQFSATDEWQHIYIYLTNFIAENNGDVSRFQILFGAFNAEDEIKYIYLDNIKLIHF